MWPNGCGCCDGGDVEPPVTLCSICNNCSVAEGICIGAEIPEMSLFLWWMILLLLLLLFITANPKELVVGGDDMDVVADVEADNAADAQLEEEEEEVDDDGVNISLVSVCEATKEAH